MVADEAIARGLGSGLLAAALSGCGDGPQFAEVGRDRHAGRQAARQDPGRVPPGRDRPGIGPAVTDAAGKYVLKAEGKAGPARSSGRTGWS